MKHKHIVISFLFSLFLVASTTVSAQSFGVRGGVSSLSAKVEADGESFDQDFLLGFQGGVQADIAINDNFSIETGLFLASKGFKISDEDDDTKIEITRNILTLNLPILARYGSAMGEHTIYGAVGPFFGYNMDGKDKTKMEAGGITIEGEEDLEIGSGDTDYIKALDLGLTIGAGIILSSNIQIGLSFDLGLANILSNPGDDDVLNTRALNLFVTYQFNTAEKE